MKVQVISDYHLEKWSAQGLSTDQLFSWLGLKAGQAELGIIAGDLSHTILGYGFLEQAFGLLSKLYDQVIYVLGNHDHYDRVKPAKVRAIFRALEQAFPNLVIANEPYRIHSYKGLRLHLGTMWYKDSPRLRRGWEMISDTAEIRDIEWVFAACQEFEDSLTRNLEPGDIVVTHHLPSYQSVPREWIGALTDPFFVHNMEALILECEPQLWIHGHTHQRCDYKLGSTRILCNPLGYPSERKSGLSLDPSIIDIFPSPLPGDSL